MKTEEKAGQVRRKKKAAAAPSGVKRRRPQNIKKTAPQSKTAPVDFGYITAKKFPNCKRLLCTRKRRKLGSCGIDQKE